MKLTVCPEKLRKYQPPIPLEDMVKLFEQLEKEILLKLEKEKNESN